MLLGPRASKISNKVIGKAKSGRIISLWPQEPYTLVNGLENTARASESRSGQTEAGMKETGKAIRPTAKESCITLMVTFMKEAGLTTRRTGNEYTLMPMVQNTKVSGLTTSSTVTVSSLGLTELSTKVSTARERRTERASSPSQTRVCTMALSR